MAGIVGRPLNRFRKPDSYKPLHERWGDVTISAPTDGSWNQFDNPHQEAHRTRAYGPGFVPDHPPRAPHADDHAPQSTKNTTPSRQRPFSMSTLNPRRLSVRLVPRSKQSADSHPGNDRGASERRTEFAYKPIHQDYPTEVAEHVATQDHPSPRFKYIPAGTKYPEDRAASPIACSRSRDDVHSGFCGRRDRRTSHPDDVSHTYQGEEEEANVEILDDDYGA
ncbi:uncharacterized protein ATNIH1004_004885 [Aspergillus tanneri]|uniref:Uncharacterized protein n=1 Tax=Aspergillus tanneri TaxID=1220188 RepID=A0A5M9MPN7_9EURO|nr:uncharacterized protein ATNIH1004_004885 [Aspergillus tanneri]KAA8648995.1 hypothetical protein ATNIH1004_004885 [Aspergillus tanneri]